MKKLLVWMITLLVMSMSVSALSFGNSSVRWWFEFDDKEIDATGNKTVTASNTDYTLTAINGNASFDSVNGKYVEFTDSIDAESNFTIQFWGIATATGTEETALWLATDAEGIAIEDGPVNDVQVDWNMGADCTLQNDSYNSRDSLWHMYTFVYNHTTNQLFYIDGDLHDSNTGSCGTTDFSSQTFRMAAKTQALRAWDDPFDDIRFIEVALEEADIDEMFSKRIGYQNLSSTGNDSGPAGAPVITDVNFTSEGGQDCGLEGEANCGPTFDTTPTFVLTTDENSNCRIADTNDNYATMNSSRDCSTTGATSHTCTVISDDALVIGTLDTAYVACKDDGDDENTTSISVDLRDGEALARDAIQEGIDKMLPSAISRTSQQVYIRYVNNTQRFGSFDKVASYHGQRWLFNYLLGSDTYTKIAAIGTTINVWENNTQMTYDELVDAVVEHINSTK